MKTSASKRVLYLIVILLVLLLGGAAFYFKDVISNGIKYGRWFTVDRYEELFDYCDWEKNGKDLNIKCRALVENSFVKDEADDLICYKVKIISRKESSLVDYDICDNPKSIHFVNPYFSIKSGEALPIELTIVNKNVSFRSFIFDKINMDAISQRTLDEWLENETLKNNFDTAKILLVTNMSYNNFTLTDSHLFPNTPLNLIRLYSAKLENISGDINNYHLEFSGFFANGTKPFKLLLNTKGFAYSEMFPNSKKVNYLEKEAINTLLTNREYDVDLVYTLEDLSKDRSKLDELCSFDDELAIQRKSLCLLLKNGYKIEPYNSIQTNDDFVKYVIDNSDKVLENMIITQILNLGITNDEGK